VTIFQKIINREIEADIVFEDDRALAFRDIQPIAPVHVLVIPKKPIQRIDDAENSDEEILGYLLLVARDIARQEGIATSGYRIITNNGMDAGQSVDHLHLHLVGGRAMAWPPG
jgi:histidine triad (HIT) family protein